MEVDSQASPQSVVVVVLASLVVPVSQPAVLRAASIFLLPASTVTPHIPTDLVMNQREGERETNISLQSVITVFIKRNCLYRLFIGFSSLDRTEIKIINIFLSRIF